MGSIGGRSDAEGRFGGGRGVFVDDEVALWALLHLSCRSCDVVVFGLPLVVLGALIMLLLLIDWRVDGAVVLQQLWRWKLSTECAHCRFRRR